MYFKKLVGKKVYLSPIDVNDAEVFTEWLNDIELLVNLQLYNGIISVENEKVLLDNLSKEHNYSIIDFETNKLIGNCGFFDIDHVNQTAEIGIFIGDKKFRNKGYGAEALSLLIDYGLKALNFHNIMLRVYEYNKSAIRCYEKIGFKQIGKRRKALYRNLEKHDIIFMDLLQGEFYENNKRG
jgi:RimJ/RimL family protein N-acetyltransferase